MLFSTLFMLTFGLALLSKQVNVFTAFSKVKLPLCLLILWFGYGCIFLIPLPVEVVQWLSPNTSLLMKGSGVVPTHITLTISKALTLIELAKIASVVCVFCLCYLFAKHKKQQNRIIKTLFYSSAVMAIYSQINYFTEGQYEFIKAIPPFNLPWSISLTGTFSYKNQYAIYLAMTIAIGFGVLIDELNERRQTLDDINVEISIRHLLFEKYMVTIILLLVMLVTFTGTNSRGGGLVFGVAIVITLLNYSLRQRNKFWFKKKAVLVFGISTVVVAIFLTSNSFERFETLGLKDNNRGLSYKTALSILKDYPMFGTGPGTYSAIQQKYKDVNLGNTEMWNHVHNDYLELLATQGMFGALFIACALLLILHKILTYVPVKNVGTVLGGQVAIVCILVHSAIDFNFGTLALSVYFFVIVALLLRMTEQEKITRQRYGQ
ncbi:O-antigen ligase family protein [Paraglaciecola arctica]|uniref:O-antigen ligase family protein n=1 Tax=Paraglaciecola arctica TaxID=1128911 RepID=UPI001C07E3D3|nr:O-antigen ligase family protein [Paraglaciecola arctica]MBU3004343.1 O-antigen ligase family protein [Paraglaciecola arctica]